MSPHTPVIVGAAELCVRPEDELELAARRGPIELMVAACQAAATDAGVDGVFDHVGWIAVAGGVWRYRDPGRLVAEHVGATRARTALASLSGHSPQLMVGLAADRIARGELDAALVIGGEARWTMRRLKQAGLERRWIEDRVDIGDADEAIGEVTDDQIWEGNHIGRAPTGYALMESAIRARRGETHDAHRQRIAELWAGFSAVAAEHPFAWDRELHGAAEIAEPTPANRMIAWPYTKAMVANNQVDMATAVLVVSTELADRLGVAADRRVHPHVTTVAHDTILLSERDSLGATPAVATAGHAALEAAGIDIDDVAHLDLYSCFPSIVEMSTEALGIADLSRPLTQTGGLGFGGAPMGNASGHGIAAMVRTLRSRPGEVGLVHANGGTATKHAIGIYSTAAPSDPVRLLDVQERTDLRPRAFAGLDHEGDVTVEAATVEFDRDGPASLVAAVLTGDEHRTWCRSSDPDLMDAAMTVELIGRTGRRDADGGLEL